MMKKYLLAAASLFIAASVSAQSASPNGGISADMLSRLRASYQNTPQDRAVRNAMHNSEINVLALNSDNALPIDTHFSHRVESKGITNQKKSGRCWAFTGLNVLRAQMMAQHDLPELTLSQNYQFFYDQLEKSNLFLQGVIDTASKPMDDQMVDWLFSNPLNDGGTYSGIADLVMKYGVVPSSAMRETAHSENTSTIRQLISLKLREQGLRLREMASQKKKAADIQKEKEAMLSDIYRMLVLAYGQPPTEFEWTRCDSKGKPIETKTYTPQSFYKEYVGDIDLKNDFIMVMNDPMRPYWKLYEIDFDRHVYDGINWKYINLPIDEVKKLAIASIKDSTMMYFSCDVAKQLDRNRGYMDLDNYDYASLFGVDFGMDKRERIMTHASGSSHAMTLMAVDLDENEQPRKWMVENSWGPGANDGHLIMTDRWFEEYMFRLAVNKKYASADVLDVLNQTPTLLPAWDPMFLPDE